MEEAHGTRCNLQGGGTATVNIIFTTGRTPKGACDLRNPPTALRQVIHATGQVTLRVYRTAKAHCDLRSSVPGVALEAFPDTTRRSRSARPVMPLGGGSA